jgi:XRE family aerobic/anaerobic benzoate catabolism transcriptional regulator
VVAAAGGVVNEASTWELLCERSRVVWLRARPEDHWNRVVGQGDRRPMADNPAAMDELRAMLRAREPAYRQAWLRVDTTEREPGAVASIVEEAVNFHG